MKGFTKLNIFLLFIFINTIQALNPKEKYGPENDGQIINATSPTYTTKDQRKGSRHMFGFIKNLRTNFRNRYNRTDTNYNNGYYNKRYRKCNGKFGFGVILLSIWGSLVLLYFLINRRKKTFNVIVRGRDNNLPNYMNV